MHKLICLLGTVIIICSSTSQRKVTSQVDNRLTTSEKNAGWKLLFDGKTTAGWHGYGQENAGPGWKVVNGAIMLEPDKTVQNRRGVDLVTNEEYENFHLKIDWKIGQKGNSGIILYIHEDTAKYQDTYNTGMEMQVLDNGTPTRLGHPDAKIYSHRAGDLYDLVASKEAVRPQGEWNHVEVISNKGKLDFYMNGTHTLSVNLWDENWKQMVAISKFRDMPGFGIFKKGKISLQDHGDEVAFKNLRIKPL